MPHPPYQGQAVECVKGSPGSAMTGKYVCCMAGTEAPEDGGPACRLCSLFAARGTKYPVQCFLCVVPLIWVWQKATTAVVSIACIPLMLQEMRQNGTVAWFSLLANLAPSGVK